MADTEAIMKASAQAVVEAVKTISICVEGKRQNTTPKQKCGSEITRHSMGPCPRQAVFNWIVKDR